MKVTRRAFVKGGLAAFTWSVAAPHFLSRLALAQGAAARNLVVLYLGGGNDALSMVVPYGDRAYHARRPTLAVPAAQVRQLGRDAAGRLLGLHPRLGGLWSIFDEGALAIVQRTGYPDQSRSHFLGTDIWSTGDPDAPQGPGWLGRYLDRLPAPRDPLVAWNTTRETPRTLLARTVAVPAIPSVGDYAFATPNTGTEAEAERAAAVRVASHVPIDRPHIAFVNATASAAFATLDRVAGVARYRPSVVYPASGLGRALQAVAGAIATGVGTRVFWVQTGGFDTHGNQGTNQNNGHYAGLMTDLDTAVSAFYGDVRNQGLLGETLLLQFSEFGRRIDENGSRGTDHGAGSVMMLAGGGVRGGLHGTAPDLDPYPGNPTLENAGRDIRFETDFRSVYAAVLDQWLGADSVEVLGADYRNPSLRIL